MKELLKVQQFQKTGESFYDEHTLSKQNTRNHQQSSVSTDLWSKTDKKPLIKETKTGNINDADTFFDENHSLMALLFAKKRTVLKTLQ